MTSSPATPPETQTAALAATMSAGLVGFQRGSITASYATGNADGGVGSDEVGGLVGQQHNSSTITASWGFGSITGWDSVGSSGSDDLPMGVTAATGLTAAHVPASWNAAASNTKGAWDFGTTSQAPALNYADYDGATVGMTGAYTGGHNFHCASDAANAPDDAILIPGCDPLTLIPGVVTAANVLALTADITVISGTTGHRLCRRPGRRGSGAHRCRHQGCHCGVRGRGCRRQLGGDC